MLEVDSKSAHDFFGIVDIGTEVHDRETYGRRNALVEESQGILHHDCNTWWGLRGHGQCQAMYIHTCGWRWVGHIKGGSKREQGGKE